MTDCQHAPPLGNLPARATLPLAMKIYHLNVQGSTVCVDLMDLTVMIDYIISVGCFSDRLKSSPFDLCDDNESEIGGRLLCFNVNLL